MATLPLVGWAAVCWHLGLLHLSQSIFEGCLRTALQLSWLATLLRPIFQHGVARPVLVVGYCSCLLVLAAYEATSRTKYDFDGQFYIVLASLVLNVGGVALFTFGIVLRRGLAPCAWNPRYVIPMVGMLLGNSINAVALALNALTTAMVEQRAEMQTLLAMGATPTEAVARIWTQAITTGATPVLQMMRVTGIISIPGMMTGQILGGSATVTQAARYQMLIIFLIATSTLGAILTNAGWVTLRVAFAQHQQLHTELFLPSKRKSVLATIVWGLTFLYRASWFHQDNNIPMEKPVSMSPSSSVSWTPNNFDIRALHASPSCPTINDEYGTDECSDTAPADLLLRIRGMTKSLDLNDNDTPLSQRRVLWKDLHLDVRRGDLFHVSGASGVGKSTFFQALAGLQSMDAGKLQMVQGDDSETFWDWHSDVPSWRRQVRYVPQTKVDLAGTPSHFIEMASKFHSWKHMDHAQFSNDVVAYLTSWGLSIDCLDKEWSQLSGGESQRVMIAISLASNPMVILFDESTSSLDMVSKMTVEESIKSFVRNQKGAVLWISHDEEQASRMSLHV